MKKQIKMGKASSYRRGGQNFKSGKTDSPSTPSALVIWRRRLLFVLFWGYVLIPLGWGVTATAQKAWLLFK
jgi:hypothetical protein